MGADYRAKVLPPSDEIRAGLSALDSSTLWFVGNEQLLQGPLLGLLCSRECPGSVIIETLDRVSEWAKAGRVVVSGFHSPLEQQVLRSLLRRKGRVVKVLARGMARYRPLAEEYESLEEGRLLVLSACPAENRHATRESALRRNRWVIALASELAVPYVREQSPLAQLLEESGHTPFIEP